ncbi:uncharacterized protein LOC123656532 [Melitaea cinxia]|uniref:uncharacterized protein LOC123656532 n=1 Tax=Melitaea cinxia TaxID=113334 RepID=UPI001E26EF3D|nr:uncharacterized protein LOC123656532 [Melitaea cinxia]
MECSAKNITNIQDILNEKQLEHILSKVAKPGAKIVGYDLKSASAGLVGFLGDHLRLKLYVKEDLIKEIHLFIKSLPMNNQPKADFITQNSFNKREALLYKIFEEIDDETCDSNPWRPKAYIYTDNILVMPDLGAEGYKSYPSSKYLDKNHVMVTATSIARFHAAFANYETKKTVLENKPYNFFDEYGHVMTEPVFYDTPWLRAAAKLTSNLLKEFSTNSKCYPSDLEERLVDLYIRACDDIKYYEGTLNVLIHKDLWFNNILFRYSGDVATNAVLIDFQCMRFAPPAFDMMLFLHLTTTRSFRERHESEVLRHYYTVFSESLDDDTKRRMVSLNYDLENFLAWCEKARLFGMLLAAAIFPYSLMDPVTAKKTFDDPETFTYLLEVDRSVPVIEHAKESNVYRIKQLELSEEIVEKYLLRR